jgi:hypothetical protein
MLFVKIEVVPLIYKLVMIQELVCQSIILSDRVMDEVVNS